MTLKLMKIKSYFKKRVISSKFDDRLILQWRQEYKFINYKGIQNLRNFALSILQRITCGGKAEFCGATMTFAAAAKLSYKLELSHCYTNMLWCYNWRLHNCVRRRYKNVTDYC